MIFETRRLILRPWAEDDAQILYTLAQEPVIGLSAGWAPHSTAHESLRVIQGPLGKEETYAIVLRDTGEPIGSVGLITGEDGHVDDMKEDEAEIGYWVGLDYWGNGYAGEAVRRLLRHAFSDLHKSGVWGAYFDENVRSGRVQAKTGFVYHHTQKTVDALGDERIVHYTYISEEPAEEEEDE